MRVVIVLIFCFFCTFARANNQLVEGDNPPLSFGTTAQGEELTMASLPGKIVIVTFWASWCAPCRDELSVLARVRKYVPDAQLEIIAINFGEERSLFRKASKLLAATGLKITHDRSFRLSNSLGIEGIPYMLMIDHTGKIKHIHTGFGEKSLNTLVEEINAMLKAQQSSPESPDVAKS